MKFLKSKKFWFTILALIIIGLLIYFIFVKKESIENGTTPENGEIEQDEISPISFIRSPTLGSWHSINFSVKVLDDDLESGLDYDSCEYKVVSYKDEQERSSGWMKRKCNFDLTISVGENKMCSFEGKDACWIYVRSKDNDNNQHIAKLSNKSVAYFSIDWSKPFISKIFITNTEQEQTYPINIKENKEYILKTEVIDNVRVAVCYLYINDKNQGIMLKLDPDCYKECVFNKEFKPETTGTYKAFAVCKDTISGWQKGETMELKTNLAPIISSCRVVPSSGNFETNFQFFLDVLDPDNNELYFSWDFNDGESSSLKNPIHYYENPGTYKPQVIVSDNQDASDTCTTAWVSVVQ